MLFPATHRKKLRSRTCKGPRWAIPWLCPSFSPNGRWPWSATSSPSARRKFPRSCEKPASAHSPYRVDESASEGQGHLFWVCVQGRLLEVVRCMERGRCNCGQFRTSVDFLKKCRRAADDPRIRPGPKSGFCTTICGLAGSVVLNLSAEGGHHVHGA